MAISQDCFVVCTSRNDKLEGQVFSLRKRKTNRTKLITYLILGLSIILYQQFYPKSADRVAMSLYSAVSPITNFTRQPAIWTENFLQDISFYFDAIEENKKLHAENKKLETVYKKSLKIISENKELRYLANMAEYLEYDTISAEVYFDSSNLYANSLLVKVGENNGVRPGFSALTAEGLVGRILEVNDKFSRVLLIDDYNASIPVRVLESGVQGIIKGQNNSKFVKMISKEIGDIVQPGQHLVSSSVQGLFDDGIPVGIVSKVENGEIKIAPYANLDRIHKVLIVKR